MRMILLYQVGIANLFTYNDQGDARIYQGDYRGAEMMARGARLAGADIEVMHWDGAGDASLFRDEWQAGCHGYGPNAAFPGDVEEHDVCDVCGEELI